MKTLTRLFTALLFLLCAVREGRSQDVPEMLEDIFAGSSSSLPQPLPRSLVASGATVFFAANDGTSGVELWRGNGSDRTAVRVKDINPGPGSSSPQNLVDVGGIVFFTANDGVSGRELWRSDGSAAGTYRVKDISPGPADSFADDLVNAGGTLFFGAHDGSQYGLWRSDGTTAGTVVVKYVGFPRGLTVAGQTVFFLASDFVSGREVWRSDGTAIGTALVKDIVPGSGSASILDSLIAVGNTLFFRVWPPGSGVELWRTDGTAAGTMRVSSVTLAAPNGGAACATAPLSHMLVFDGKLFFAGDNQANVGLELWQSDGTAAGTTLVKDISAGSSSNPQCLVTSGDAFYFSASDGTNGAELWRSDGTADGTVRVKDIVSGSGSSAPHFLADLAGTLFFSATDGSGTELWRSDGTESGTVRVADLHPFSSAPRPLVAADGMLFFTADDGIHGREPWILGSSQPPSVATLAISPEPSAEVKSVFLTASFTQSGTHTHTCTIHWGDTTEIVGTISSGVCTGSHTYMDDGSFPVSVTITDESQRTGVASTTHVVDNVAPVITNITGPVGPVPIGTAATIDVSFADQGVMDTHACTIAWGDSSTDAGVVAESDGSGVCSAAHLFAAAGVYRIAVTISDDDGGSVTQAYGLYVVIYDPTGGFVTGGGWTDSLPGAYRPDPALTGKANFGFGSKYRDGALPAGETEFHFRAGGLTFKSTAYAWLVISDSKARFRGTGILNGTTAAGFEIVATDGQANGGGGVDRFRIRIWTGEPGDVVYDNELDAADGADPTTALGGGSIVIHQ